MNFVFIQATIKDLEELSGFVNSAYRGESSKKGWTTEADLLGGQRTDVQELAHKISTPDQTIWLLKNNSKELLGCIHLTKMQTIEAASLQDKSLAHLGMLTVSPQHQNLGLGKKILDFAEDFCKTHWQSQEMELEVISVRKELIAFYLRRGYVFTNEVRPFPMTNPQFGLPKQFLEFLVMKKVL